MRSCSQGAFSLDFLTPAGLTVMILGGFKPRKEHGQDELQIQTKRFSEE